MPSDRCTDPSLKVEPMQSWSAPNVPELPGRGPQLRLFDSADRKVRPVSPGETATMYVCGITPYDATHLGHAATYLTFDLVHRVWLRARARVAPRPGLNGGGGTPPGG